MKTNIKVIQTNATNIESFIHQVNLADVIQTYIGSSGNLNRLMAKLREAYGEHAALVADQILLHHKAIEKLPEFIHAGCWLTKKSFEQCSSQATAAFKSTLFSGEKMLDLSAGLGIDDLAFSKVFQHITALDTDTNLNALVRANHQILGIKNINRINSDAETYLKNNQEAYDLIYVDADRRSNVERSFGLADSSPNVLELMPLLLKYGRKVLLKLSPLFDIHEALRIFKNVSDIYVVEWRGEVKELLVVLTLAEYESPHIHAVRCDDTGQTLYEHVVQYGSFQPKYQLNVFQGYLYEPSAALIKSGLAPHYLQQHNLFMPDSATYLAACMQKHEPFFGRRFRIIHAFEFSKKDFQSYLKQKAITKAHITARNFPEHVESFRKKWKLKDGGDEYLFLTQQGSKLWCIHAHKD